jgi:hypothetical protein
MAQNLNILPLARSKSVLTCFGVLLLLVTLLAPRLDAVRAQDDADTLAGAYAVSITEEDVPLSLIGSATLRGAWIVSFNDDGSYGIERQDVGQVVAGSYEVAGDEVTITDESGLLSCGNLQPIGDTQPVATYSWQKTGDLLQLEPSDEGCSTRQVLLATRALAPFVACRTVAVELSDGVTGPVEDDDSGLGRGLDALRQGDDAAATPGSAESSPTAGADGTPAPVNIGIASDPEEAIADLVGQLNACWATGDPARVLPLFSQSFLEDFAGDGGASLEDLAGQLRQLQTATIAWELAGDIEADGDEATAVVASTIGGEETLQTFTFVRDEEGWRLDNLGE